MQSAIERDRWQGYLDDFSKRNQGRPTRIELISEALGAQPEAEMLPLMGVSFERKGSEAGNVEITLAGLTAADTRYLRHAIINPKEIVPKTGADGREDGLEIEASDGARTILMFETLQAVPETTSS